MLNFLQIRDYAIVESLELDFSRGFTCITGETGAGKSILVGALGLLCGNRADTGAIRSGAQRAELAAAFDLAEAHPALLWLRESALDDASGCLLRRVINDNGRSRAWINGTPVTLSQLAELGEHLVEIHGQNEHLRLTRNSAQFDLLDGGGSHDKALSRTRETYFAWHALEQEKQSLLAETPLHKGDLELMRYQLEELESDMLAADDFLALEQEHRRLARGGEIVGTLGAVLQNLQEDDEAVTSEVHRCAAQLQKHADLDHDIAAAVSLLNEAVINCEEAGNSIQSALARMDLSPERLEAVENSIGRQHDLARKHRVQPDRLEEVRTALGERLERAASLDTRLARIDNEIESALAAYRAAARELHKKRAGRARKLSADVTALMQDLGMQGGCFRIDVRCDEQRPPSARGDDRLELLVSGNRGADPGPLRKVASGGELSRISLAVKIAGREKASTSTQIFDEVDAGIGGETAHAVGALLKSLAADGQALCVTHLAQVAVFADYQLRVSKSAAGSGARVETTLLQEADRVDEVARMLGGQLSEQSRAHAAELLGAACGARH